MGVCMSVVVCVVLLNVCLWFCKGVCVVLSVCLLFCVCDSVCVCVVLSVCLSFCVCDSVFEHSVILWVCWDDSDCVCDCVCWLFCQSGPSFSKYHQPPLDVVTVVVVVVVVVTVVVVVVVVVVVAFVIIIGIVGIHFLNNVVKEPTGIYLKLPQDCLLFYFIVFKYCLCRKKNPQKTQEHTTYQMINFVSISES